MVASCLVPACLVASAGLAAVPPGGIAGRAGADTLTMSADAARSSWYPDEPALAPSNLDATHFGQLFTATLDGQVYAQPLVRGGTLLAVTEHNSAYGVDAATGTVLWQHNYGTAWNPSVLGCGDLLPEIGITSTPVIDPATGVAYFSSKVATSPDSSTAAWYLHAVSVATGVEQAGFPVQIAGTAENAPTIAFDPLYEMQRPDLALVNGVVYLAFGGHCDHPPYAGWVVGVSTAGAITSMWVDETGQSGGGGAGIWQSGAAPVVDAAGDLYVLTGNGTLADPGPALGSSQPAGLGECAVKLATDTGGVEGALSAADWFCPSNGEQMNLYDGDLGSGGPTELPAAFGSAVDNFPMLVGAGKSGVVYLLDMNDLGGMDTGPGGTDRVVSEVGPYGGVWSKPAAWAGEGGYVYLPTASPGAAGGGSSGRLNVFKRVVDGAGGVSLSLVASSADSFGFSSSSAVVTSDGTTPGSGVVWIVHANDASGAGATLRAYDAVPQAGQLVQLWSSTLGTPGTSAKFNPPAVDNGRVYVGTRDGTVLGFGALAGAPALRANSVSFPPTSLGSASVAAATFTATGPVTVNSLAVQGPAAQTPVFAAAAPTPTLPATLQAGQQLSVPMTFTPSALGLQQGTLTANTSQGAVNLPLAATGLAPSVPVSTSPPSVDFGTLPAGGAPSTSTISFTNTGAQPFVVTGVGVPADPFSVTGAPATDGSVTVAPGDSIGIGVRFTPPATGGNFAQSYTGQLTLQTSVGDVLVPVLGAAAPPAQLAITPSVIHFGAVAPGHTVTRSFTVANTGGTPLTILKSKPPVANRFAALTALQEGSVIEPGASVTETVRFAPGAAGALTDGWVITGDDGSGAQTVRLGGSGAALATVPPPAAGGWTLNGAAQVVAPALRLTGADPDVAGSAFWPHVLSSDSFDVSFDALLRGGTGADGLTLALADASRARPGALGGDGDLLGFGGVPGVAVALHTFPDPGNSSPNSIGIVTGLAGGALHWAAVSSAVPPLRTGSHLVEVRGLHGELSVYVDGLLALHSVVTLPPTIYLGFTGATGGLTDVHRVQAVQITGAAPPAPPVAQGPPPPAPRHGFRTVGADGGVFTFGGAPYYGSTGGMHLNAPVVGMASDAKTRGYWLVASDGGVFAFHAPFLGSTGGMHLNAPIVGMAATTDGRGYWLVASDGGVFTFGDARFHGSTGGMHLNAPIVGMASDAKTGGYRLVASDGGVFAFDAPFLGSRGGRPGASATVGIVATPAGDGYWLVARDGGVFPFGAAPTFGRAPGAALPVPIAAMALDASGAAYAEAGAGGRVFLFGRPGYTATGVRTDAPIVGAST